VSYGHAYRCNKCGYQTDLGPAQHQPYQGQTPAPNGWSVVALRISGTAEAAPDYTHLCRNCTDDLERWLGE